MNIMEWLEGMTEEGLNGFKKAELTDALKSLTEAGVITEFDSTMKKSDMVDFLIDIKNGINEEKGENEMENMNNEMEFNVEENNEVEFNAETPEGEVVKEDADKVVVDDKPKFFDKEGKEMSMSAFAKMKFVEEGLSRKEISEEFGINYRTVYGATMNLDNGTSSSRGRSGSNETIKYAVIDDVKKLVEEVKDEETQVVSYVTSEVVDKEIVETSLESLEGLEIIESTRNDFIKETVEGGEMTRADAATLFGIAYGTVHSLTKGATSASRSIYITVVDEKGEEKQVKRIDYIRKRFDDLLNEDKSEAEARKVIKDELGVNYNIVYNATKKEKTIEEKYNDILKSLESYVEKVTNPEEFRIVLDDLKTVQFLKEEDKEDKAAETVEEDETVNEETAINEAVEA